MKNKGILFIPRDSWHFWILRLVTSGGYGEQYLPQTRLGLWCAYFGISVVAGMLLSLYTWAAFEIYRDELILGLLRLFGFTIGYPAAIWLAAVTRNWWLPRLAKCWQPIQRFLGKPVEYL